MTAVHHHRRGFALVELVIVLVIVTVAAAITAPRYAAAVQRYRADAAARRVAAQFDLVVRRARAQGRELTLAFDTGTGRLAFTDADGHVAAELFVGDPPCHAKLLAVNVAGGGPLTIDGYGQPASDATITLAVGREKRAVSLDAGTARVQTP